MWVGMFYLAHPPWVCYDVIMSNTPGFLFLLKACWKADASRLQTFNVDHMLSIIIINCTAVTTLLGCQLLPVTPSPYQRAME